MKFVFGKRNRERWWQVVSLAKDFDVECVVTLLKKRRTFRISTHST
jgi:hypothetical protein